MKLRIAVSVLTVFAFADISNAAPIRRPCGPNSLPKVLKFLIPQGAAGADFRPACRQHDACYKKGSGISKKKCDSDFLHNMLHACKSSRRPRRCKRRARIMYRLVNRFGAGAYGY